MSGLVLLFEQIFLLHVQGDLVGLLDGVDGPHGFLKDFARDVGGQDGEIKAWGAGRVLGQDHGQGIWLLAAGAARAPELQGTAPADSALPQLGQHHGVHDLPVFGLAKEMGGVGGDHVHEVRALLLAPLFGKDVVAVFLVGMHAQGAQPFLKARLEQHLLGGRHLDAELALYEFAEALELAVAHLGAEQIHGFFHGPVQRLLVEVRHTACGDSGILAHGLAPPGEASMPCSPPSFMITKSAPAP